MKPKLDTPVDEQLARRLIAAQFPALRDASVRLIGAGWDNAAYLVEEHLVFRFPQRKIVAPLISKELAALPLLAPQLPFPIPRPLLAGEPSDDYPYPFSAYEILFGAPADTRELTRDDRRALGIDLGRFLRALHDLDPQPLRDVGLPNDEIGKLDPKRLGVDEPPLEGTPCIVHGDLYEKHLLLDARNRLCGVIDWGDVHYGLPAVDLSAVHMLIPPDFYGDFLAVYGHVDDRAWQFAAHRARYHIAMRASAP
ncbi:MAG TPA: phosphotransferase [Alphaproteobacteria bacterium]|nr:phosphotransferase [Alphaproteobacteria bacterium]